MGWHLELLRWSLTRWHGPRLSAMPNWTAKSSKHWTKSLLLVQQSCIYLVWQEAWLPFKLPYMNLKSTSNSWEPHSSYCHSSLAEDHKYQLLLGFFTTGTTGVQPLEVTSPRWCGQQEWVATQIYWTWCWSTMSLLLQHLWAGCLKTLLTRVLCSPCLDPTKPAELHPQIKRQGGRCSCFCCHYGHSEQS